MTIQLDHIEVFVPDRYEAAAWYQRALGLEIIKAFEFWATDGGPLIISGDEGSTKLALFTGTAQGAANPIGIRRIAFGVDGAAFLDFLTRIPNLEIHNTQGTRVQTLDVIDHDLSWSVYFADPYGNRLELTTYDYDQVATQLSRGEHS